MRFKPVPDPPASPSVVDDARRSLPLAPEPEADCRARLRTRLDLPSDEAARTWLTFLRALDLAERTDSGYRRRRVDSSPERLRRAFREGVFGAREVRDALADADGALSERAVFDRVRDGVPAWERHRDPDWERRWCDRIAAVLGWLVLLGSVERAEDGYRLAE